MPTKKEEIFYFNHGNDWTIDTKTGRYYSSERFKDAVADTDEILCHRVGDIFSGKSKEIAESIVINLAVRHGLSPLKEPKKKKKNR